VENSKIPDKRASTNRQPKQQNSQADSITGVNRDGKHGVGIWGNPRVVMAVRVDSELKKQFIPVAKRVFGSVCNPIESFMAAILACQKMAVNFGNTVTIDKIVIERNLRPRRKLEFEGGVADRDVYCPLNDCFVPLDSLPLPECAGCGTLRCLGKEVLSDG